VPHRAVRHDGVGVVVGIEPGLADVLTGKGLDCREGFPVGDQGDLQGVSGLALQNLIA